MTDDLQQAIANLAATKDEHRPLLATIARDAGMDPATRAALVEHIYAEEDEKVAHLQAALGAPSQRPPRPAPGLTVGSLRSAPATSARGRLTVGSLRRD